LNLSLQVLMKEVLSLPKLWSTMLGKKHTHDTWGCDLSLLDYSFGCYTLSASLLKHTHDTWGCALSLLDYSFGCYIFCASLEAHARYDVLSHFWSTCFACHTFSASLYVGVRGRAVARGTMLQAENSRVWVQIRTLNFSIYICSTNHIHYMMLM
jgi:hypothetical protein